MIVKGLFFYFLTFTLFAHEPFFTLIDPPKGWQLSDPSKYEQGVKVGFIASKRMMFSPSLTLSTEKVGNVTMDRYIQALKEVYIRDRFQELGTFETFAGKTHLFQIDRKNGWGEIRILQAITIYEGFALIQTGSFLKKDFLSLHETYLSAFKSLKVAPSLLSTCKDSNLEKKISEVTKCWNKLLATSKDDSRTIFNGSFFQNNQWKPFVNYIENELESEGMCWQFLALKYVQESLLVENKS